VAINKKTEKKFHQLDLNLKILGCCWGHLIVLLVCLFFSFQTLECTPFIVDAFSLTQKYKKHLSCSVKTRMYRGDNFYLMLTVVISLNVCKRQ